MGCVSKACGLARVADSLRRVSLARFTARSAAAIRSPGSGTSLAALTPAAPCRFAPLTETSDAPDTLDLALGEGAWVLQVTALNLGTAARRDGRVCIEQFPDNRRPDKPGRPG